MSRGRYTCGAVLLLLAVMGGCDKATGPTNIVLMVVDTARADHFTSYGYTQPTSPRLDAFGREAIRFTQAYSVSSWTLPSHASMFTGLYPVTHHATQEHLWLDDGFETLAEVLHGHGYATAAFSGNPWVSRATHLAQGFDVMEEMWGRPEAREDGAVPHATNRKVFEWLDRRVPGRPFFLFINYIEPHFPYAAPPKFERPFLPADVSPEDRRRAQISWVDWYLQPAPTLPPAIAAIRSGLYDAELAYADSIAGELLDELRRRGLYDGSLIVITSDHGENLTDHGHLDHVFSLYNSTLHVPLFLRLPHSAQAGTTRDDPVQLVDVFSTLLAAVGIRPGSKDVAGHDMLTGPVPAQRAVLAEYDYPQQALAVFPHQLQSHPALDRFRRRLRSIQVNGWKFIWGSNGRNELYDLAVDPLEQQNVIDHSPDRAQALAVQLQEMIKRYERGPAAPMPVPSLDTATQERLRSLGYLR